MSLTLAALMDLLRFIVIAHAAALIFWLFKSRNRDRHVIIGVWLTASLIGYLLVEKQQRLVRAMPKRAQKFL